MSMRRVGPGSIGLLMLWIATTVWGTLASAAELKLAVAIGPVSLPVYVARAQGYFRDAGVNVDVVDCRSGRECLQVLERDACDLATGAELQVVLNSMPQPDLAVFATISTSQQIRIVADRRSGIKTPMDLKGRRVGTLMSTSAEYYLDAWLLFHDIDRSEVRVVPLPSDQMVNALREHAVDAVAIWEPTATQAATELGMDEARMPTPLVYRQHFVLIGKRPKVAARQDEMVRMLRALARAGATIARNPSTARAVLRAKLGIDDAQAAAYLREHDYKVALDQALVSTMESQARWAVRSGQMPATGPPRNLLHLIEPAALRVAAPGAVTLVR